VGAVKADEPACGIYKLEREPLLAQLPKSARAELGHGNAWLFIDKKGRSRVFHTVERQPGAADVQLTREPSHFQLLIKRRNSSSTLSCRCKAASTRSIDCTLVANGVSLKGRLRRAKDVAGLPTSGVYALVPSKASRDRS
jgi:hypothetical protein